MKLPTAALLLIAVLALMFAGEARASWMVPGAPYRPKDFAIVKRDGLYHLFYIRRNVLVPYDQTENDLGHAVSKDLWIWNNLPGVIPARPTSWDQTHIWAPSIVEQDGVWYMFYTGVSDVPGETRLYQRTGVAISTDLMNWSRLDAPVWSCASVPWSWCDSLDAYTGFRDPFVMEDPAAPGHWLMYTTTFPASDHGGMVVDVAASSGDLTQWSDVGPLWASHRSYSTNVLVESPHLFSHNGLWYLFYTSGGGQPLSFSTGPNPVGQPGEWTYRGRLATMLGTDTFSWYASEHLSDGLVDYFAFASADRIEVYRMVWGADWTFSLVQPDFMHVYGMGWDSTHVAERDTTALWIAATEWSGRSVAIEAAEVDSQGFEHPVSPAAIGLPGTIVLNDDTTRVQWTALRPDTTSPSPARLRVRLADRTAQAGLITVDLPLPPPPPLGNPDPGEDPPVAEPLEDRREAPLGIVLRSVTRSPLGPHPTFLIETDAPDQVRLDVYDLQGRHVRNLAARSVPAGATLVQWDERDASGATARPGIYFVRMIGGRAVRTARVVIVPR
jgi:hypothetical protein